MSNNRFRRWVGVVCFFLLAGLLASPEIAAAQQRPIQARLASEEIEGDPMTVWAEKFAEDMMEWSDGNFQVTVYPFGTLGENRDINELAQLGVIEFVFSDYAWSSAFVPEATVVGLHYMWPEERVGEVIDWVVRNGEFMGILEASFRREGLVPLSLIFQSWQWITANRPIRTIQDMEGLRVRLMASAMLVEQYRAFGASPTPMGYGEIYGGLQTGLIDGQVNPMYAIRSMNFYEVQDYFAQTYAEPFIGIPAANAAFFDSLPAETQRKIKEWWVDAIIPSAEWVMERVEADLEAVLARRPQIEVIHIDGADRQPFIERGRAAHTKFLEIGGPNAEAIYNALVNDIEQAKQALGIP